MDELTCNRICHLLCCPPLPSKIAAKLAFMPPPTSYSMITSQLPSGDVSYSISFLPFLKDAFSHIPYEHVNITMGTTKRRNKIVIAFMNINPESKLTFLLSHGNAVDLGLMMNFMYELGTKLNVNIMCYDYSGYGVSSGKPLEKNLYADAECAMHVLMTKYGVPLDHIVLYGQSIGTVPTVHLATIHRVAAVVLHSPLMSGLRVAFPRLKRNYCCDVFSNYVRAPQILSPTLIIHGTDDEIVHPVHAQQLLDLLPKPLTPLFIIGAGHNDCELFEEYLIRLEYMVHVELGIIHQHRSEICSNVLGLNRLPLPDELLDCDERDHGGGASSDTSSTSATESADLNAQVFKAKQPLNNGGATTTIQINRWQTMNGSCRRFKGPWKGIHKCNTIHAAQSHVDDIVVVPTNNTAIPVENESDQSRMNGKQNDLSHPTTSCLHSDNDEGNLN